MATFYITSHGYSLSGGAYVPLEVAILAEKDEVAKKRCLIRGSVTDVIDVAQEFHCRRYIHGITPDDKWSGGRRSNEISAAFFDALEKFDASWPAPKWTFVYKGDTYVRRLIDAVPLYHPVTKVAKVVDLNDYPVVPFKKLDAWQRKDLASVACGGHANSCPCAMEVATYHQRCWEDLMRAPRKCDSPKWW
jgi:hypothetical protein